MPRTSYGTHSDLFGADVDSMINDYIEDGEPTEKSREVIREAWLDAVQRQLPEGVTIHGDDLIGPAETADTWTRKLHPDTVLDLTWQLAEIVIRDLVLANDVCSCGNPECGSC